MKKLLALLLALAMLFSVATLLAGCDDSGKKKNSSSKSDDDEDEDDEDDEDDGDNGDDGTSDPSGSEPTTGEPTTGEPTTGEPTTGEPTAGGDPTTPPATEQKNVLLSLQECMDAYVEVATGKGTSKLERLAPSAYWSANGYTMSEIRATFPEAYADYANGETLEARCTLISYELLDATETAQIAENLKEVGLDANKVEAAATAVGNMYSSNGVEVVENQQTIYGVCYDGQWYAMLNQDTLFGDFIIFVMDKYTQKPDGGIGDVDEPDDSILNQIQDFMDTYVLVGTGKNFSGIERLAPRAFWEASDYTLDEIYANFPDAFEKYADGMDWTASCQVRSCELLDSSQTAQIAQNLSYYGLDASKVEATAAAVCDMYSSNGVNSEELEQTIYAFCYDGQWYAMINESSLYADFVIFVMDTYSDVD